MNIGIIGQMGEKRVAAFLRKRGFAIVKRNYQCRFGEIDIIAENDEYIIFVEVKTRKKGSATSPLLAVDLNKQHKIMLTAQDYLSKVNCTLRPRFDVAEVTFYEKPNNTIGFDLNYIKNAF